MYERANICQCLNLNISSKFSFNNSSNLMVEGGRLFESVDIFKCLT